MDIQLCVTVTADAGKALDAVVAVDGFADAGEWLRAYVRGRLQAQILAETQDAAIAERNAAIAAAEQSLRDAVQAADVLAADAADAAVPYDPAAA